MSVARSTVEATSMARVMTKRELIAMHILAAYSNGQVPEDDRGDYSAIARAAVLQADALLGALHDDPEEDDG